jgi:transposase
MLTLPPSVRIFVAAEPVDARKSFNGLTAVVRDSWGADPLTGHLFCFINRRGDMIQILFWDRTGFVIMRKRSKPSFAKWQSKEILPAPSIR